MKSPISNHSLQRQIWLDQSRFKVAVCGRRFGKTFLAREKLAASTDKKGGIFRYIAPTRGQAKALMWNSIKNAFEFYGWKYKKNESELWIERNSTGARIHIFGAENHDRLRGYSSDGDIYDEFANIDIDAWTLSGRPCLSDRRGWAWFLGTPAGLNHFYDLYNFAKKEPDWSAFQFKTIDSPFFQTPDGIIEVEAAKRDLDEKSYRQEYEASFESFSGRIYYEFDRARNVGLSEIVSNNYIGMDFNVDPFTGVMAYMNQDTVYIHDELFLRNSNTQEASEYLKQKGYVGSDVTPDYTGIGKKTSSAGKSDHAILIEHGFRVNAVMNPHRVDRYAAVNRMLKNGKLIISHKCKHLINDLEKLCYKEGTCFADETDPMLGHITDALGYLVYKYHGIIKKKASSTILM